MYLNNGKQYSIEQLMVIYEQNYRLLLRLAPDVENIPDAEISSEDGRITLHLKVLEQSRYTTTIHLTHFFKDEDGSAKASPDLNVRLYHDAQVAEVYLLDKHGKLDKSEFGISVGDNELASKCKINGFLEKWLAYCVATGYHFHVVENRKCDTVLD
jgi:uncharacterized protein